MGKITVTTKSNDTVKCVSFIDGELEGIELFENGNRLGELHGYLIPDENDEEEVKRFTNTVEDWIVDNGF